MLPAPMSTHVQEYTVHASHRPVTNRSRRNDAGDANYEDFKKIASRPRGNDLPAKMLEQIKATPRSVPQCYSSSIGMHVCLRYSYPSGVRHSNKSMITTTPFRPLRHSPRCIEVAITKTRRPWLCNVLLLLSQK